MELTFKKIDLNGFERIWDSDYNDAFVDSHKNSFKDTPESYWRPLFVKHLNLMHEVFLGDSLIGYIFLSPKEDGTAHLGYGVYKKYRGNGLSIEMCKGFMAKQLPLLDKKVMSLMGTTLEDNIPSQKVLLNLNFSFHEKIHVDGISYLRFKKDLR